MGGKKKANSTEPIRIGDDVLIKVKSGFHGTLFYNNPVSGETTIWEGAGDIQIMSMRELRAMKARHVNFFKNQWVIIAGVADSETCKATPADICKNLVVAQYYVNAIDPSNIGEVCDWSLSEIKEKIPLLTAGAKENLIIALTDCVRSGRLDSIKKIKAFEEALNCELQKF